MEKLGRARRFNSDCCVASDVKIEDKLEKVVSCRVVSFRGVVSRTCNCGCRRPDEAFRKGKKGKETSKGGG